MASGKLTARRMEVSHYSAPRRNGCVIIAQAGPAVGAHRAVAVIQRDPVDHLSSDPGSRGAAVPVCAACELGINLSFRRAQGREESRLSLAQQPVQVRAALPGPPGSLLGRPGSFAADYHCRWAPGLGVAHTVLRRGLFRDAAALAAGWPVDRDDSASTRCRESLGRTASGDPADGQPHYRLARTAQVTPASRHDWRWP